MAFEKVLAGGSVIDGTGKAAYRADVAIAAGRIAAIGDLAAADRAETIDATGQVVCPGFIDMHAHSDVSMLDDPGGECKAYQGVTTEVVGNCGSSAFPAGLLTPAELQAIAPLHVIEGSTVRYGWSDFDGWATALEQSGISLNVVGQIGHSTLRQAAKATEARPANDQELAVMKRLVAEAVEQGAVALTTQLTGPPAAAAPAGEIAALAAEAHRFPGAFYATHARLHNGNHFNAVDEAIEIGELTGIPVQYSHIALIDTRHHGEGGEMVRRMEVARERGVDVLYDVYPYTAGACGITGVLPLWAQEDGAAAVQRRLADPETCARMTEEIARGFWGGVPLPWDKYVITKANKDSTRWMVGKVWTEIAARRGESPVEAILSVAREDCWLEGVLHIRSEDDVRYFVGHPLAMIGSDGTAVSPDGPWGTASPHPRFYGCYPRVLGRYVRELGVLTLEDAVHKMTGAVADRLQMESRGRIAAGTAADLVVFDPDTVIDNATWEDPHRYPDGISHVLVNGESVIRDGTHTQARAGRVLRRGAE